MVSLLRKIVGDSSEKAAEKILPLVREINALEAEVQGLSDSQLRDKTEEFRSRLSQGDTLDDLLPEAFAVYVR